MPSTLAVTGKGGTGKTILSALMIQHLVASGRTPVLAVDADANANLHEVLGLQVEHTVGGIREAALSQARELAGISKQELLDLRVQQALVERSGFDLLVMGRPEGRGCYCFANNVLREVIGRVAAGYRQLVVDSEAGLEHLSRRTLLAVDLLCIVSDATVRGVRTARRVAALVDELETPVSRRGLIINRVTAGDAPAAVTAEAAAAGLEIWATIPADPAVEAMDGGGRTVDDIPDDAPVRVAVRKLLQGVGL